MNIPLIEDALRQYAAALENGELDGAGRYLPADLIEQADLLAGAAHDGSTEPVEMDRLLQLAEDCLRHGDEHQRRGLADKIYSYYTLTPGKQSEALETFEALEREGWMFWKGVHRQEAVNKIRRALVAASVTPYTRLEVEHCIRAENRWGETFIEAVHDPERVKLSDVLDRFWSVYGRRRDGRVDCLHDTSSRGRAMEVAATLSICAFNSIPIIDRSPEDLP